MYKYEWCFAYYVAGLDYHVHIIDTYILKYLDTMIIRAPDCIGLRRSAYYVQMIQGERLSVD